MSQRLVRILCSSCKTFTPLDPEAWRELTLPWQMEPPRQVARPVGCKLCRNTGYMGRQGIYEVLVNSPGVQPHIVPQLDTAKVRAAAMAEGMHTLRLSGASRVARGETTIEEVMRVAPLLDA
jgi:general secretion pathway protein E